MIIELIIALIVGILIGTLTGLTPGIHINLVAVILLSFSGFFLTLTTPTTLAVFIIAMAITHTFVDYIPSIFLGAPDEDSFLSVLPGHQLLLKGRGYYAVIFTLYGGLAALLIILFFTPIFIYLLPIIYPYAQRIMWIILILVSVYLISTEKEKKFWALVIFLLSGFLGISTLSLNIKEPLLPLFTGLFGASSLIISIKQKTNIPVQKISPLKNIRLSKNSIARAVTASIIASPFTSFLPGLGASQAALIGSEILREKEQDKRQFLFLLGAINTLVMGLSFITLYAIQKTRTGAAVAVSRLIPELTPKTILLFLSVIFITGIFSFIISVQLSKFAAKNIHKIKYEKLSIIILSILIIMTFLFSDMFNPLGGVIGLLIFLTGASLGVFTVLIGVKRMHLMGCLLIPTILFYLL